MNINIEIGDVVLNGVDFSESQSNALQQSLRSEIGKLIDTTPHGLLQSQPPSVRSTYPIEANASPDELATQLADAIAQRVGPPSRRL